MEILKEILMLALGSGIALGVSYLFAKANPKKFALLVSKLAVKVTFNNENAADKIEDAMGDWLINLGKELKNVHPDEDDAENPS